MCDCGTYISDLSNSLIDSCFDIANVTIPSCKPKCVAIYEPGWSDDVKNECNSHWIWIESGKQPSRCVYDVMKITKHINIYNF